MVSGKNIRTRCGIGSLLQIHGPSGLFVLKRGCVNLKREVPNTARYGRLVTGNGRVLGFVEKGVTGPGLLMPSKGII